MIPVSVSRSLIISLFLLVCPLAAGDAKVSVRILDPTGKLTPARAWMEVNGTRHFQPSSPDTVTVYAKDQSFSCDGVFTMVVAPGKVLVHVEKGKEFIPIDLEIQVEEDAEDEKTITLERWSDMPDEGWYSADLHVHLGHDNIDTLRQLALADDVNLIPSFTYWLRGQGEIWRAKWPDESHSQPILVDDTHFITRNNIEIERIAQNAVPGGSIGATFLFNLKQPISARRYGEHYPTDATLCRAARALSPNVVFDSDKPSWSETVIGAALGMLDTVQVCHNHYHRTSTLPGGWGMIGPLAPGESNMSVGDGLFHRTNTLYYRLLNCGFRLGVSGGSAIGVMPVPAGYNRVYAKVDGAPTAAKMWQAIKSGRSFATTGPMLTLTADGKAIGSTIVRKSTDSDSINIRPTVGSIEPLESLEIVHDGRVVQSLDLRDHKPDPILSPSLTYALSPKRSGWIVARALYRAPDGLLRQAHASPIYMTIDEKPTAYAEDARYMLKWIDALEAIVRSQPERIPDTDARQEVTNTYSEARRRYEQILLDAQRHWGL